MSFDLTASLARNERLQDPILLRSQRLAEREHAADQAIADAAAAMREYNRELADQEQHRELVEAMDHVRLCRSCKP